MDENNNPAFPQFRKYPGGRSWFAIFSPNRFTEYQRMGERWLRHEVNASIHPDRMRIQDMLECEGGLWETVEADAFEAFRTANNLH